MRYYDKCLNFVQNCSFKKFLLNFQGEEEGTCPIALPTLVHVAKGHVGEADVGKT